MSSDMTPEWPSELPDIDERLVAPETRYEIEDGRLVYVPPADPPHAECHLDLGALLKAHRADGFKVAVDMLTRTSRIDDIAPDVSVYPTARDPKTGRQLDHLSFEIASTERLAHAGKRAVKLIGRGVRRVFAIDVERARALEWSTSAGEWSILDLGSTITDPSLAVPLPVRALVDTALVDATIEDAMRARRTPGFAAERAEGRAEGRAEAVLVVLAARGLVPSEDQRSIILGERDLLRIDRWLVAAGTCADVSALLT